MKILKIFGFVAGIHLFALILIFANPGCSSSSKSTPAPSDTVARAEPSASVSLPMAAAEPASSPMTASPIAFNPDAPATATGGSTGSSSGGIRFNPTRPGTPAASTLVTTPVADVTPAQTYTVKANDTLWELGKKFKVPYAEIAAANNIKTSAPLHAGQKLIIPGKAPGANGAASAPAATNGKATSAAGAAAAASSPNGEFKHVVKPNETLSTIAKLYGVTQGKIAVRNNITDPQKIRAGAELIIPDWKPNGSASAKASAKSAPAASGSASTPAASAPAPAASRPVFNLDPAASSPTPASGDIPLIKVEESPMTPAPRTN